MSPFLDFLRILSFMLIAALVLLLIALSVIRMPIDQGQDLSRLETAGIMRCANV